MASFKFRLSRWSPDEILNILGEKLGIACLLCHIPNFALYRCLVMSYYASFKDHCYSWSKRRDCILNDTL